MYYLKPKCKNIDCNYKKDCCKLPTEVHDDVVEGEVDIFFVLEAPGKEEEKQGRPVVGKTGTLLRNVVRYLLNNEYGFNFAISNIYRNRPQDEKGNNRAPTKDEVNTCKKHILRDIRKLKPKVIVCLGSTSFGFIHGENPSSIFMESGKLREEVQIDKNTVATIATPHPSWCSRNDPNTLGFIYRAVKNSILYNKGVNFNINPEFNPIVLDTVEDVKSTLNKLKNKKRKVVVDTECDNLYRVYDNKLLCVQLSNDGKNGYIIPLDHFDSPFSGEEINRIKKILRKFFTTEKTKVTGYIYCNSKFDLHQLFRELGVINHNAPIIDISFNEYLLEENWARVSNNFPKEFGPYSLGTMAYKLGFEDYYLAASKNLDKGMRKNLSNLHISEWKDYAAADVTVPYEIYKSQLKQAKYQDYYKQFKKMAVTYNDKLTKTLTYVEHCGLPADVDKLRELYSPRTSELVKAMDKVKKEFHEQDSVKNFSKHLRKSKTGYSGTLFSQPETFNPSSRIHLEKLFFNILNLSPVGDKLSVDKAFQKQYKDSVYEVKLLADWNRLQKLKTSYIDNIHKFMNKTKGSPDFYKDERIRAQFNPRAVTGRLRASDPNVQQRVSKGDRAESILSIYRAKPGKVLIKVDYSTFEVRGLGFVSGDKAMIDSFREMHEYKQQYRKDPNSISKDDLKNLTDFHKRSASLFNNVTLDQVTDGQRQGAKGLVFGSMYGRSAQSIANELGISTKEAEQLLDLFLKAMPDATDWLFNQCPEKGQRNLYVESPIGRRRRLWGFLFDQKGTINKMKRLAMNCLVGSSYVETDKGLIKIKDLVGKEFRCYGKDGSLMPIRCCVYRGKRECRKIVTNSGFELEGSEDHPVQILDENLNFVWKELKELEEGDYVCIKKGGYFPKNLRLSFGKGYPNKMDKNLARLSGYLASEGNIYKSPSGTTIIHFSNKDDEVVSDYLKCWYSLFPDEKLNIRNRDELKIVEKGSNDIAGFLEYLGISDVLQHRRRVPWSIMQSPKDCVIEFLRAYYEGDGGAYEKSIGVVSASKGIIKDIQLLLLRLGIISNKYNLGKPGKHVICGNECNVRNSWVLNIVGSERDKFEDRVGFISSRKIEKCKNYNLSITRLGSRTVNFIPNFEDFVDKNLRSKLTYKSSIYKGKRIKIGQKKITPYNRLNLEGFIDSVDFMVGKEWGNKLREIKKLDFYYGKVVKNKKTKSRKVYDIEVPEYHHFISNGIVVHNSIIQGLCSDLAIIATSLIIEYIYERGKGKYQVSDEESWMVTNLVHDSCEMEIPVNDVYRAFNELEPYMTNKLQDFVKKKFGFEIKIDLEVDFEIGFSYDAVEKWDDSDEHARKLQKKYLKQYCESEGRKLKKKELNECFELNK